jgi:hypothetical protein
LTALKKQIQEFLEIDCKEVEKKNSIDLPGFFEDMSIYKEL